VKRFNVTLTPLITLKPLSWQDTLTGLCLILGYLNLMLVLQQTTTINIGQGWDGYYYYQMAARANIEDIYYAFKLRYGLPWLAGVFPTADIFLNFKLINLVCGLLYAVCCYIILQRCSANMHPAVPIIGWYLLCMSNLAPIPSLLWYPIQTDIVCSLFALLFLMMVITGRLHLLAVALLFFAGTTVRENFPVFLLYGLLSLQLCYDANKTMGQNLVVLLEKNRSIFVVLGVGFLASIAGLYSVFKYTGSIPFASRLWDFQYISGNYINNPARLLAVIINSVSAVLFFVLAGIWSRMPVKYSAHIFGAPFAKLIVILLSFVAVTGGTNPERYWYWAMPFLVLCILPGINNLIYHKRYLLLVICLLWALFIQRALVPIDAAGIFRDCGFWAILTGQSNWIGHWADQCSPSAQKNLVLLAVATAALVLLLASVAHLRGSRKDLKGASND
jgi:hypothetical protein